MDEEVLLISADPRLTDLVLAAGAAAGRKLRVGARVEEALDWWQRAAVVLVGPDLAPALVGAGPPRREDVYLLAGPDVGSVQKQEVCAWSMPLGAPVITLPQGSAWLVSVLSSPGADAGPLTPIVAVLGGSGGVGASSLAAGLALRSRGSHRVALVEADGRSGGIDLLLGAEGEPGWRWPVLAGARGQLSDLTPQLPQLGDLAFVAMSRSEPIPDGLEHAIGPVVASLSRTHGLVVLDCGRGSDPLARAALGLATRTVLVCGNDLWAVAACRQAIADQELIRPGLVVRLRPGGGVAPSLIARTLQLPMLGSLPDEPSLSGRLDRKDPPGRVNRMRWSLACDRVLADISA